MYYLNYSNGIGLYIGESMKIDLRRIDFVELPTLLVRGSIILSNNSFNLLSLYRLVYRRHYILFFEYSGP
jgi:hypothetical protein